MTIYASNATEYDINVFYELLKFCKMAVGEWIDLLVFRSVKGKVFILDTWERTFKASVDRAKLYCITASNQEVSDKQVQIPKRFETPDRKERAELQAQLDQPCGSGKREVSFDAVYTFVSNITDCSRPGD